MVLEWVQENIENFGGDKTEVTIMGESAGGASVAYHLLSTLSKGLFQRAILQSSAATPRWGFVDQETALQRSGYMKLNFNLISTVKFILRNHMYKIDLNYS